MPGGNFECSTQFKALFNEQLEAWKLRTRGNIDDLAERCGVSRSYLGHMSRYGRIPSKPVLLLLLLNFEVDDARRFLSAAAYTGDWPYELRAAIRSRDEESDGLLSIKLDLDGLSDRIRGIVRSEFKHRDIHELTSGRPLRMGVNMNDHWLFRSRSARKGQKINSSFSELCRMLGLTMRCEIEPVPLEYADYGAAFERKEIDFFGPTSLGPNAPRGVFTNPFIHIGLSALCRVAPSHYLDELPRPRTVTDLLERRYSVAVVRGSTSHLFAKTRLARDDDEIVLCDTIEEGVERLTMTQVKNGAHLMLCNALNALHFERVRSGEVICSFVEPDTVLKVQDTVFAVRADWPELADSINGALAYLIKTGTLSQRFESMMARIPEGVAYLPER